MPGQAPPLTDERQLLLADVRQQRDGIRSAAFGLTDDQARLRPTAGDLSIGAWSLRWVLLHLIEERGATPGMPTSSGSRSTAPRCTS